MEETKEKCCRGLCLRHKKQAHDKYQEFVTEPERETFIAKLQEVEDWLYEDGEDETKGVYIAKLEELKKQGDPIEEEGVKEHTERGTVIDQLTYCVNSYRKAAALNDAKFEHIHITDEQKLMVSMSSLLLPPFSTIPTHNVLCVI